MTDPRAPAPAADEAEIARLKPFGWAPGKYTFKCVDCPPDRDWRTEFAAKHAWRCKKHAEEAAAKALAAPASAATIAPAEELIALIDEADALFEKASIERCTCNHDEINCAFCNTWRQARHRLKKAQSLILAATPIAPAAQGGAEEEDNARDVIGVILDGYPATVEWHFDEGAKEGVAFLCVENPEYQPDNGKNPRLVIDLGALSEHLAAWQREQAGPAEDEHLADRYKAALEIVAGHRQCVDNLMSNVEVAREALRPALTRKP